MLANREFVEILCNKLIRSIKAYPPIHLKSYKFNNVEKKNN